MSGVGTGYWASSLRIIAMRESGGWARHFFLLDSRGGY